MIICRNCGHENPEGPEFCTNCGAFLPWDKVSEATRRQATSAVPA